MPTHRNLSTAFKAQLFQPYRDKDFRILLTVDHASFTTPYRFIQGSPHEFESFVSNGLTYLAFPFDAGLLSDDDSDPQATIRIQNADDRIGSVLLELPDEAVTITLQVIALDEPDTVQYEVVNLELVDVNIDAMQIQGRIVMRGAIAEPCPGRVLTSKISPVFFR